MIKIAISQAAVDGGEVVSVGRVSFSSGIRRRYNLTVRTKAAH
jgi:hypothetical protein